MNTNLPWEPDVDRHWKYARIKYNYYLKGRIGWQGLKSDEFTADGPYLITGTDFKNGHVNWESCYHISDERFEEAPEIHVRTGDLLVTKDGTIGKTALIDEKPEKVSLNSHLLLMRPINANYSNRFLFWVINSPIFEKYYGYSQTGTIMASLSQEKISNFTYYMPDIEQQEKIADYLDDRCSKIDEIIAEATASIEEYKELKQAVITEAVTKGMEHKPTYYSDDPNIGEVPIGWHVCKTLYGLSMPITDGPHTTPELYAEGVPFVSAEAISCGQGSIDFDHIRGYISEEFYQECCKKYIPAINDIYMIKSGATTGRVSMVDTNRKFTIWSPLAVFRVNQNRLIPRYLFYFLQSRPYQQQVQLGWTYGTQQNIGMRTLEKLKICMPPLMEQEEIVAFLDCELKDIDALINEKQSLIADLQSYKKSLIYEVVTGKRRVV